MPTATRHGLQQPCLCSRSSPSNQRGAVLEHHTLPTNPSRFAAMSDPIFNYHFRRGWTLAPMTSRQIERASEIAAANGNMRLADDLAWFAHSVRAGREVSR